jgi:hypothetical protein
MKITFRFLRVSNKNGGTYRWGFVYTDSRGKSHRHVCPNGITPSNSEKGLTYAHAVIQANEEKLKTELRPLFVIDGGKS